MITITESAQEYLAELLSKQEDALGVRVFINDPGTPRAETCIAYCRDGDIEEGDFEIIAAGACPIDRSTELGAPVPIRCTLTVTDA